MKALNLIFLFVLLVSVFMFSGCQGCFEGRAEGELSEAKPKGELIRKRVYMPRWDGARIPRYIYVRPKAE